MVTDGGKELSCERVIWWMGAGQEMLWCFDMLLANGADVGVVAIDAVFLLVSRKPFVDHFDDEGLLGQAKSG